MTLIEIEIPQDRMKKTLNGLPCNGCDNPRGEIVTMFTPQRLRVACTPCGKEVDSGSVKIVYEVKDGS